MRLGSEMGGGGGAGWGYKNPVEGCVFTRPIYQLNILSRCLFTDQHLLVKHDTCFHCEFFPRI